MTKRRIAEELHLTYADELRLLQQRYENHYEEIRQEFGEQLAFERRQDEIDSRIRGSRGRERERKGPPKKLPADLRAKWLGHKPNR